MKYNLGQDPLVGAELNLIWTNPQASYLDYFLFASFKIQETRQKKRSGDVMRSQSSLQPDNENSSRTSSQTPIVNNG